MGGYVRVETIVAAAISAFAVIAAAWINTRGRGQAPPPELGTPDDSSEPRKSRVRRAYEGLWTALMRLPAPSRRTTPWLAALVGFLFSGFGVALYFRKGPDVLAGLAFLLPLGLAGGGSATSEESTLAWWYWIFAALAGLYCLLRAESANRRLDAQVADAQSAPLLAP
jgi:hypothetical protein